jgi:hypothetical protein
MPQMGHSAFLPVNRKERIMARQQQRFLRAEDHETATHAKHRAMLHKLEEFLHAYYDLLEETGGPPDQYRPLALVQTGLKQVEQVWWDSLDDDG